MNFASQVLAHLEQVHVLSSQKSNDGEQGGSCHSGCASVGLSALWPSSLFITACHFLVLEYGELIGYLITFAIWVFIATLSYFVFRSLLRRTCKSGSVNSAVMKRESGWPSAAISTAVIIP